MIFLGLARHHVLAFIAVFAAGFAAATYLLLINPLNRSAFVLTYFSTLGQLEAYVYATPSLQPHRCSLGRVWR